MGVCLPPVVVQYKETPFGRIALSFSASAIRGFSKKSIKYRDHKVKIRCEREPEKIRNHKDSCELIRLEER